MMRAVLVRSVAPARPGQPPVPVSILELLDWCFRREWASLDLDAAIEVTARRAGPEWVMMQRALLGCRVDGGGRSEPHPDCDVICGALAMLPEAVGGRRMAAQIAELARAGLVPDAAIGACPKFVPLEMQANQHGTVPRTRVAEVLRLPGRNGRARQVEVRYTPVDVVPDPRQVAALRRGWLAWWGALLELRALIRASGGLSAWVVTDQMPPLKPWLGVAGAVSGWVPRGTQHLGG